MSMSSLMRQIWLKRVVGASAVVEKIKIATIIASRAH
jgi:hypothetical protein